MPSSTLQEGARPTTSLLLRELATHTNLLLLQKGAKPTPTHPYPRKGQDHTSYSFPRRAMTTLRLLLQEPSAGFNSSCLRESIPRLSSSFRMGPSPYPVAGPQKSQCPRVLPAPGGGQARVSSPSLGGANPCFFPRKGPSVCLPSRSGTGTRPHLFFRSRRGPSSRPPARPKRELFRSRTGPRPRLLFRSRRSQAQASTPAP